MFRVLQVVLLWAILPVVSNVQTYTFTTIDYPGARATGPNAINASGVVVGSYLDNASTTHGFIYYHRDFVTFDVANAKVTGLTGINKHGDISGFFADSATHGFVWRDGAFRKVNFPGAVSTWVNGVADTGSLGGTYTDSANKLHGFVRDCKGRFKTMDFPGADETSVNSINKNNQLTGQTSPPFLSAFLFSNHQWLDFYYPGALTTTGDGINNLGQIVGIWNSPDHNKPAEGFLRNADGTFQEINFPGSSGTGATGINDRGLIVGSYNDSAGISHGFIAKAKH
jgi:uncharacterized membrane protein